ncbi:MAG: hypothetical protein HYR56_16375, partial [Acidobacteria bacterium]|nr:hypothetical protein [Acidobacteriota bacterium]
INAQVTMDEGRLRAQGEFKLRQSDYKFKPVSVAGGTLKLEDELHFRFDLAGVKFSGGLQLRLRQSVDVGTVPRA